MRHLLICCAVLALSACQSTPSGAPPAATSPQSSETAELNRQREAFLAREDFNERLARLIELEQQALQLTVDEPLKLGSIGSAILDIYPGSHTGHYVMSQFYSHVESAAAKAGHDEALRQLQDAMRASGDGSHEAPYRIMTIYDAHTYARTRHASPVGSIYQSSDHAELGYMLVARPERGPLQQSYFDLSHLLDHAGSEQHEAIIDNPWSYIRLLATRMDSAAQTAIGAYLSSVEKFDDALGWLGVAARADNVLANRLMARIYWTQAEDAEDPLEQERLRERSLENHLHAITLGSTDSMYTLANLYLNDIYGVDNRQAGVALLQQAADTGHVEAQMYLGHLFNTGNHVAKDPAQAAAYFRRAAQSDQPDAVLSYGRFLLGVADQISADAETREVFDWLERLTEQNNAEAMIVLGNLHARGIGTRAAPGQAVRWYKRAVRSAEDNADIVNEVAWTLTVSDIAQLKRTRYARRIMDRLMRADEGARSRPEFLDTWAATHAAEGDFASAVDLQQQAIAAAAKQARDDVMEILQQHLEQFEAGATITEKAP